MLLVYVLKQQTSFLSGESFSRSVRNAVSYPKTTLQLYIPTLFMRWAGHVARMGGGEAYTGFWWGNLKEREHLGDPGLDGWIILRWIFRKWDVGICTGSIWLRIGTDGGNL